MHKRNFQDAAPLLERALEAFLASEPEDLVTIAKLRDSVGMCYDGMGRHLRRGEEDRTRFQI